MKRTDLREIDVPAGTPAGKFPRVNSAGDALEYGDDISLLDVWENGAPVASGVTKMDIQGPSVTITNPATGEVIVTIGSSPLSLEEEGTEVDAAVSSINFIGDAVTVSAGTFPGEVNVDIGGSGGGGGAGTPWADYTPALSGSGTSLGDGVLEGRCSQFGKTVLWRASLTIGSTTVIGSEVLISLPSAADSVAGEDQTVAGAGLDSDVSAMYQLGAIMQSGASAAQVLSSAGPVTATVPFTWAVGDQIVLTGSYEADTSAGGDGGGTGFFLGSTTPTNPTATPIWIRTV